MNFPTLNRHRFFKYLSFFPFVIAALIGAHIVVVFGVEVSFFEALLHEKYYKAMAGSFPIALFLTMYVYFVSSRLDKYWCWVQRPLHRVVAQFLIGVLPAALLAFLLAFIYFRVRGYHILDTMYLRFDFPVILLLIILLNMFYALYYLYRKLLTKEPAEKLPVQEVTSPKETITVHKGVEVFPIAVQDICYAFLSDEHRYIQTFQGERYLASYTLEEMEELLEQEDFFRANRQMILNIRACTRYRIIEHGKLEVFTEPPYPERIIVSQRRAKAFKVWMDR